jgi:hypothetical protein
MHEMNLAGEPEDTLYAMPALFPGAIHAIVQAQDRHHFTDPMVDRAAQVGVERAHLKGGTSEQHVVLRSAKPPG